MATFDIGVHQLVHLLVSHPGEMNSIDSGAFSLNNVGYKGTEECPREKMIDKFYHPLLSKMDSSTGTQLQTFMNIQNYIQETHSFPLSNYVVVDTRIQTSSLKGTRTPEQMFGGISGDGFHTNITVSGTELELVGYLVYVAGGHYTTSVKRNGTWWSVTDLGETYEDMVSNEKDLSYNGAVFSVNGKWNQTMLPQAYPVSLVYKNINEAWKIKFKEDKPSVTRNPGTACYILSPCILYANLPELVMSILGKTESSKYIENDVVEEERGEEQGVEEEDDEDIIAAAILAVDADDAPPAPAAGRHTSHNKTHRKSRRSHNLTKKHKRFTH
jgi:hypothetical protein